MGLEEFEPGTPASPLLPFLAGGAFLCDAEDAKSSQRAIVAATEAFGIDDGGVDARAGQGGADFPNPRIVPARRAVGAEQQPHLCVHRRIESRRFEVVDAPRLEAGGFQTGGGPSGLIRDMGRSVRGCVQLLFREVGGIGITGPVAADNANAGPLRDRKRRILERAFLEMQALENAVLDEDFGPASASL